MADRDKRLTQERDVLQENIRRIGVKRVETDPLFKNLKNKKKKHDERVQNRVEEFLEKRRVENLKEREEEERKLKNAPTKDAPQIHLFFSAILIIAKKLVNFKNIISETIKDATKSEVERHIESMKKALKEQRKELEKDKPGTSPRATTAGQLDRTRERNGR